MIGKIIRLPNSAIKELIIDMDDKYIYTCPLLITRYLEYKYPKDIKFEIVDTAKLVIIRGKGNLTTPNKLISEIKKIKGLLYWEVQISPEIKIKIFLEQNAKMDWLDNILNILNSGDNKFELKSIQTSSPIKV